MAEKIGVRELKNQTSQIVRAVREDMAEYVITLHGKPVAMLRPITEADEEALRQLETAEFLSQNGPIGGGNSRRLACGANGPLNSSPNRGAADGCPGCQRRRGPFQRERTPSCRQP
ncbi:MAG: type II toxin-antitoxin system prevent-host-death family antitoxin [Chloroflexi bacterium]|nr:type II toxin-antitoxin system prevent-host-death family antitoxin [Chloroflexota bacterium]